MNDKVHRNSEPIPLHRVAVVRPFAHFLANIGAPVEREFIHAGLPYCALEHVDNYVPSHRFWAFLVNVPLFLLFTTIDRVAYLHSFPGLDRSIVEAI